MKKVCVLLAIIFCFVGMAWAADFPEKPITHIIPAKAGGGFDRSSRVLSVGWEKVLGQPIKFDYKPGASGMIGMGRLMAQPPDGYTTIMTTIAMQAMNMLDFEGDPKDLDAEPNFSTGTRILGESEKLILSTAAQGYLLRLHRLGWPTPSSISTGITPGYRVSSGQRPASSRFEATSSIASATRSSGVTLALRRYSSPRSTS